MSNKMPKPGTAKTASAPKRFLPILVLAALVLAASAPSLAKWWGCQAYVTADHYSNDRQLHINDHTIKLMIAETPDMRGAGLSNRPCIPNDQGMLFVFEKPGNYPIWMKDMKFSIDVIWLNSKHQVTDIKSHVAASTYPQTFTNSQPAQYVLEIPAGRAKTLDIHPGTTLKF